MRPIKITTKVEILAYLQGKSWTSGTELEDKSREWRTKSSVISRRCRELVSEGKLLRRINERKAVEYMLAPNVLSDYLNAL